MSDAAAPEASNSTAPAEEASSVSALRDNIATKGKNAYYYAHSHKADGPAWDGKPEPKLLGRVDSTVSSSTSAAFDIHKSNITSYAFLDDGPKVRLYVDLPGIQDACAAESTSGGEGMEPAKVNLEWTETSMRLLITNYPPGEERCLSFGRLHGAIEKGMVKTKKERLVVTLVKKGKKVESKEVRGDGEEGSNNVEVDEPQETEPQYEEWPSIAAKD